MRLLKLSPYYAPERISSSHLSEDLENAYAQAGVETELYCPTPTRGITAEEREQYKTIKYEETHGGAVKVHRFAMFREGRNPIGRALRYVLVNLIQYWKGSRAEGIDVIMSGSTPPTQGLLCGMVKKRLSKKYKRNVPFVYNLQDVFPDSLVNANMTKKGSLIWKIGRKLEDYTYRSADRIITVSEDVKQNILEKGVPEHKITVIPNWINTEKVCPVKREDNPLFDELGLNRDGFYVVYAGNLGNAQGVTVLAEAAERLAEQNITFLVFGNGACRQELEERAKRLPNFKLFPLQPAERVAEVYSMADVSFVGCKAGFGTAAVPSKSWSIMATATPIVLSFDEDSALSKLVREAECGVCAPPEDAEALAKAILYAYTHRDELTEMGQRARRVVEEGYSAERCTKAIIDVLTQACEL